MSTLEKAKIIGLDGGNRKVQEARRKEFHKAEGQRPDPLLVRFLHKLSRLRLTVV